MNLMDLFIKVGVKDEASGPLKKLTGAVGGGLKVAAAAGAAAVTAAAAAVGKLVTESVKAYGEYEQLVGGINKLYGEGADQLLKYANEAYQTAGMSANQYMQNVTGFSAALINSLGGDTEQAAEIANMAMKDISDNANTFGKYTAEELAGVYQALAKGQYQTLDNLNLGFGGTKEGMQSLIDKANELRKAQGETADLTIDSYADIVQAIHEVQKEMGIMDTTANEAASTIQGSLGMLKASWENLLTGLSNPNADLGSLFDNLVESAMTAFNNLRPVISQALQGVGKLVKQLAPVIGKELPGIMKSLLPDLISAATGLASALSDALPEILGALMDNLPAIASAVIEIASNIFDSLVQAIPELMSRVWTAVDSAISNSGFGEKWQSIKEHVAEAVEGIKENWDRLKEALQPLIDRVKEAWDNFIKWADESGILEGAIDLLGVTINTVVAIIGGIAVAFEAALQAGEKAADWLQAKWQPVADFFSNLAGKIESIFAVGPGTGVGLENIDWSGAAVGNDYVPYNGYPAMLHRGEAVLTAREADAWRRGSGSGRQIVNNFSFNGVSQSDLDYIVGYVNRELVSG